MADQKTTNSKTNQTQTQASSGTQIVTPNTPSWLSGLYQDLGTKGSSLINGDPSQYAPQRASQLQRVANQGAIGLPNVGAGGLADAIRSATGLTQTTAPTISAAQLGPVSNVTGSQIDTADIQRLLSPYLSNVVNASTGLFDKQAGQDQASLDAQAGMNGGAFGSSGYALQKSNLTGVQALDRSQLQSGLLNQGYSQASGLAGTDADRTQGANLSNQQTALQRAISQAGFDQQTSIANQNSQLQTYQQQLAAAMGLGSLSGQQNSQAANDIGVQAGLGGTQQAQDVAHQQFPLTLLQQIAALSGQIPVGALSGSTTTQNQTGTSTGTGSTKGSELGFGTSKAASLIAAFA